MASPVGRGAFSALLTPSLFRVYMEAGKERPTEHQIWANVIPMPWNPVTDQQMTGLPIAQSMPEGNQFPTAKPRLGNTKAYQAEPFGLAIEITFPMWQDELYGIMNEMTAELARASRARMDVSSHSVLNNAFDTNYTGYTSTSLCSTSHTSIDGTTTFANRPANDIGFGLTYLQGAIERYETLQNENAQNRMMAGSLCVIGPSNKFAAREIFGSTGVPYSSDNEINAIQAEDLKFHVNHNLTTSTFHFLLAAKGVHDLNFMVRTMPIFDSFDDPRTKNAVFCVYQRHDDGDWGSFRGTDGSTG